MTPAQYLLYVSCCQFAQNLIFPFNANIPVPCHVCGLKNLIKTNIGKYFILGISGDNDMVTTST